MRNRFNSILFALPVTISSCISGNSEKSEENKPNIIIIYTDDLGYGDISCYGATGVETPNIDKLAAKGLLFRNAYATSATCTPSRYSLLTGEYHWRKPPLWQVGDLKGTSIAPGDAGMLISPGKTTLPAVLKDAGYVTAVVGKWHLGLGPVGGPDWNDVIKPGPEDIGFDYAFLIPATGDRVPCVFVENRRVVKLDPDDPIQVSFNKPIGEKSTIYNTNVTPDKIVSYNKPTGDKHNGTASGEIIKMHPSFGHDQTIVNGIPRIGYMTGGHSARWRDEDIADVITERALNFIDENKGIPFFLYFSTHDVHVPRVPHERFTGKSKAGVYGDVIMQMDWCVGEIMNKLNELNLTDNTLVIFTSDNGPVLDDGYHDGSVENIGDHKPAGSLRGGKYSAFEGGTKIPFIVHWPGKVSPGVSNALLSQVDLTGSLAALVNYDYPDKLSFDSFNNLPVILGEDFIGREFIIQQNMGGTLSIIIGEWKYIEPGQGPALNPYTRPNIELGNNPLPQLYKISQDISEEKNLADQYPEIVEKLAKRLEDIKKGD